MYVLSNFISKRALKAFVILEVVESRFSSDLVGHFFSAVLYFHKVS